MFFLGVLFSQDISLDKQLLQKNICSKNLCFFLNRKEISRSVDEYLPFSHSKNTCGTNSEYMPYCYIICRQNGHRQEKLNIIIKWSLLLSKVTAIFNIYRDMAAYFKAISHPLKYICKLPCANVVLPLYNLVCTVCNVSLWEHIFNYTCTLWDIIKTRNTIWSKQLSR